MKNILLSKASVLNQIVFSVLFVPALLAGFLLAKPAMAVSWATSSSSMILPRGSFASTVVNDKIYVFGGDLGGPFAISEVESYDPVSDAWKVEPSLSESRWGLTAATVDGKIVTLVAGSPIPYGSVTTELYDPSTGETEIGANMPSPGWGAAAASINGKVYVIGGYNWPEWGQAHNREYDPVKNEWAMKAPMPTRRSWLSAEAVNGKIYVLGGWNWNDRTDLPTLEAYDPTTDTWETKASLPIGMKGIVTAVLGTKIYAIGGGQGEGGDTIVFDSVFVYDTEDDAAGWVKEDENFPTRISGGGAETINGTIYVFGGSTGDGLVNRTYYLGNRPEPVKRNPVIIVPGIIASYLNNAATGEEIWPNLEKMKWPNDEYLNDLILNRNGFFDIDNPNIRPGEIFRSIGDYDFFEGLINELKNEGYKENEDLFVFPYDWRVDINILAGNDELWPGQYTLKEKINDVKLLAKSEEVDIIAHSMGGLLVKAYIEKNGQNNVNKFIDIATPHLGSPDAFKILNYGDDLGFSVEKFFVDFGLNSDRVKLISQNFPSIYQLLPSRAYFDIKDFNIPDPDYHSYVADIDDLDGNGVRGDLDYNQTIEFLANQGRNDILLNVLKVNDILHAKIDDLNVPNSYNIIGAGQETIGRVYILNREKNGKYEYGIRYINGDGTVPFRSAESFSENKIYASSTHAYLPSADGVRQAVASILKGDIQDFDFSQYRNLSLDRSRFKLNATVVSYHSPIDLHVYDEFGNHVGPTANGDIEISIPGARYDVIEDNKFAVLPSGGRYIVIGQATDVGTFNARIEKIENGQYVKEAYFNELPLDSILTKTELFIEDGQENYAIKIDSDGDDVFDQEVSPSSVIAGDELSDLTKPNTESVISCVLGNNDYYVSDVVITLDSVDDNSGVLKTEYSLDSGVTWIDYASPITVSAEGESSVLYSSTDRAGNREGDKELRVKIDKTAPTVDILTPDEIGRSEILNVEYLASDDVSGVDQGSLETFFDGQAIDGTIDLFFHGLGEHEIGVAISDLAGNKTKAIAKVNVIIDIPGAVADIGRAHEDGMLNDKAKDSLSDDLADIQAYIERYGQRESERSQRESMLMVKCVEKRGQAWCDEKLGPVFDKVSYKFGEVHKKFLKLRYSLIIKKLDLYRKLGWVNEGGYGIIREDLEYLINNI